MNTSNPNQRGVSQSGVYNVGSFRNQGNMPPKNFGKVGMNLTNSFREAEPYNSNRPEQYHSNRPENYNSNRTEQYTSNRLDQYTSNRPDKYSSNRQESFKKIPKSPIENMKEQLGKIQESSYINRVDLLKGVKDFLNNERPDIHREKKGKLEKIINNMEKGLEIYE